MKARELGAIIFYSPNPKKLAEFYKRVIGIPFALNTHGKVREHFEGLHYHTHFAILPRGEGQPISSIIPSFRVDDINEFVAHHQLKTEHPVIDLGGGAFVVSIKDTDGNTVRLWMNKNIPV